MYQTNDAKHAKVTIAVSMAIWGTVGIFVKWLPFPSSVIAMVRAFVGTIFLLLSAAVSRKTLSVDAIRKNIKLLLLSGSAIGINWILLFESYRYTTVPIATLCYYLSPVFVTLLSPIVLKEKLTALKLVCVAAALGGMVLISGIFQGTASMDGDFLGILLASGAAVLYASVVLMNKFLKEIPANDSTVVQLGAAAMITLPYVLLTEDVSAIRLEISAVCLLLFVGIVHTGIAYRMYFSAVPYVDGQSIALLSYADPAVTILLSAIVLGESLDIYGMLGAVLILGSTLAGELLGKKKQVKCEYDNG